MSKRNQKLIKRCLETLSYAEVAKEFGISRQRVYQIWRRHYSASPKTVLLEKLRIFQ